MIRRARDTGASALARITGCVVVASAWATAPAQAAEVRLLHADSTVVSVGAVPGTGQPSSGLRVQFEADGLRHTLTLRPNEQMELLTARLGSRVAAYTGQAGPYAGSWAAITRIGNRWSGIWYDGGEYFGVDSAGALAQASPDAATRPPDSLMVFRLRDVLWEDMALENDTLHSPVTGAQLARDLAPLALTFPLDEPQRRLDVAVVGDALLASQDGEDAEANLLARLNVIDGLFASQLGVRVAAGSVTLYTSREDEPFGRTTNASDLLDEVSAWRHGNAAQRDSGLTHLFTGRNLNGRTVGMAYMDSLCSRRYSTSLSQATTSVSFSALIAAHEIAHVFGAPHDGEEPGACATAPSGFLMAPRINGSQQFSQCSLEQMAPQVRASCLAPVRAGWPAEGPAPSTGGGGGALPAWISAMLGALAAARLRRRVQSLANQSAR